MEISPNEITINLPCKEAVNPKKSVKRFVCHKWNMSPNVKSPTSLKAQLNTIQKSTTSIRELFALRKNIIQDNSKINSTNGAKENMRNILSTLSQTLLTEEEAVSKSTPMMLMGIFNPFVKAINAVEKIEI